MHAKPKQPQIYAPPDGRHLAVTCYKVIQMTYTLDWFFNEKSTAPGRHNPFRNHGEGFESPGVKENDDEHPAGVLSHWFIKDGEQRFVSGEHKFPSFLNIAFCKNHRAARLPDPG